MNAIEIAEHRALPRDPEDPSLLFSGQIKLLVAQYMRDIGCCPSCLRRSSEFIQI